MSKQIFQLFILITCSFSSYGQADYLSLFITSPEAAKDTFDIELALFSTVTQASLSGELLLCNDGLEVASDGCSEIFQDMSGYIALIDRGQCVFVDKVINAKEAGAIAVVICNNEAGGEVFAMAGEGDFEEVVAVMLSYEDCMTIKPLMEEGINVTMNNYEAPCDPNCVQKDYPDNTIWGQSGEGSFACGLGDWTSVGISNDTTVWVWDKDGEPVGQAGVSIPVEAETVCNGAAIMDFTNYTFGLNSSPMTPYPIHHSDLISPIIDLSDAPNPVVRFTQYLSTLTLDSKMASIAFSIDGGVTWIDTTLIESNNFSNAEGSTDIFTSENKRFAFCGKTIGNKQNVRIKFIGKGDFYYWTIDDVYITNEVFQDIWVDPNWIGGPPNFQTPFSQVDLSTPLAFRVINQGSVAYEDLKYTVTIQREEEQVYEYQGTVNVEICSNSKVVIVPELWNTSEDIGNYRINIELTDESLVLEDNIEDNLVTKEFKVTERTFSKLDNKDSLSTCYSNANNNTISNAYYIHQGEGSRPLSIVTGINKEDALFYEHQFIGEVREWVQDINGDGQVDLEEETILVASGEIIYSLGENIDLQNFNIPLDTHSDVMKNNRQYLAIVHHIEINNPNPNICGNELFYYLEQGNPNYNHHATEYAFQEVLEERRPISFAIFGQTTQENYDKLVLSPEVSKDAVWFVDLDLEMGVRVDNTKFTNNIKVFPNPFKSQLKLNEQVKSFIVFNSQGLVQAKGNDTDHVSTESWASGMYLLSITDRQGNQEILKVVKE